MIEHKVDSGRDIIMDGVVFRPGPDKIVHLPRELDNGDCRPVLAAVVEETPSGQAKNRQGEKHDVAKKEFDDGRT